MKILAIETSCDETAAAIVEDGTKILSGVVASSAEMHAQTGGVIPEAAARQQVRSIIPVVREAIIQSAEARGWRLDAGKRSEKFDRRLNVQPLNPASSIQYLVSNIDALAVTVGPGLIGSLLVGIETARTLALLWQKPLIPVNHLIAHIYANWLATNQPDNQITSPPPFPALALVVSGGHTDLVLLKSHGHLEWIGGTRDDASGEAFDKTARILGLPYPGGPSIAAEAAKFQIKNDKLQMFPRPMLDEDNFDFSFSGLKTAVLRKATKSELEEGRPTSNFHPLTSKLAAEVQEAIVDVLVAKTLRAAKEYKPASLLLAGGVAANSRLREKFELEIENCKLKIDFRVPEPKLCTDNAAYIAACAYFNHKPLPWPEIEAKPELTIIGQV